MPEQKQNSQFADNRLVKVDGKKVPQCYMVDTARGWAYGVVKGEVQKFEGVVTIEYPTNE